MTRVLIVDDDPVQLRLTTEVATRAGFVAVTATGGRDALQILRNDTGIGAVVLDLVMPDLDGMAVLEAMAREAIRAPVIVQTASSSLDVVVTAMRQGATDFFVKPVAPERLVISLRNALKLDALETAVRVDRNRQAGTMTLADIVTQSPAMDRVITLVGKAAKSPIPVLIEGETGVGKELVARIIQGMGDRAGKPFITVNCGAIPANLVESTLFGHRKGAFTGAVADQLGKFAEAHGGTLFLDEVGELSLETQVKLLRVLQNGEIEPVGAARTERVNVRVISATNRRLLNRCANGSRISRRW
jgi:DNA-binding NtrC family response regulator